MTTGTVYLVHDSGTYLRANWYWSRKNRSEIMESWRKMYGYRFNELYIHIEPTTNVRGVNEKTGIKHRQKPFLKYKKQAA